MSYKIRNQKPYFSETQLSRILDVFRQSMDHYKLEYDAQLLEEVETYAQSSKNAYENTVLHGVIDGLYSFIVRNGHAEWAALKPKEENKKTLMALQRAEMNLKHAISVVHRNDTQQKAGVVSKRLAPQIVLDEASVGSAEFSSAPQQ